MVTDDENLYTSVPLLLQGTARLPLILVLMGASLEDTLEVMEASMLPVEVGVSSRRWWLLVLMGVCLEEPLKV